MHQQVTDVIGPTRSRFAAGSRIPLGVKIAWTAWIAVWAPVYWKQYGAQNFLYYCDFGNLLITLGLWMESPLIISWQAVGLLVFQMLYVVDLLGGFLLKWHPFGGTEYMFDPTIPRFVRVLGLYHLFVPGLLLWTVRRLGYRQSAWRWAALTTWIVIPINFFWRPQYNINFARGIGHEQHLMPAWVYLVGYLIVVPLAVYLPTHLALRWRAESRQEGADRLR